MIEKHTKSSEKCMSDERKPERLSAKNRTTIAKNAPSSEKCMPEERSPERLSAKNRTLMCKTVKQETDSSNSPFCSR